MIYLGIRHSLTLPRFPNILLTLVVGSWTVMFGKSPGWTGPRLELFSRCNSVRWTPGFWSHGQTDSPYRPYLRRTIWWTFELEPT